MCLNLFYNKEERNKMNMPDFLKEEHKGFSGITHWLISIMFFFLMWITPWAFARQYIQSINQSVLFATMTFFLIGGASLLPDLDSSPLQEGGSTAVYQLGWLGQGLSILAITISGVVYAVLHTRYDAKPKSQHRMLFHTPFIAIALYVYTMYFMEIPYEDQSLVDAIGSVGFKDTRLYSLAILIFFASCAIYLGASMLVYKVLKLLKKQKYTQFVCLAIMVLSILYMLWLPGRELRLVGVSIALGYLFHLVGDLFSKGSIPMFFPVPVPYKLSAPKKVQFWNKPRIPFALTTGGVANTILNFVLTVVNMFLVWYVFIK